MDREATDRLVWCEKASKKVGDFELKEIDFALPKGYLLGVIGRNGCGKSTLLRCLMGVYRLDDGKVYMNGIGVRENIKDFKKQYAYVSHDNPFLESYKVIEVGELFGCYYNGFTMERYRENLERFAISPKSYLSRLSKGQQIKAQLAFALSMDVAVYVFDEPTGNLDVESREEFYHILRELMEDGEKSVIYATHLVEELEEIADYLLWIQKTENVGQVKFFGTMDACKEKYRMWEGTEELPENLHQTRVVGGRTRENHREWLVLSEGLTEEQLRQTRYADLKEIMYYEEKGEVR